jgi:hypothetical protein
MSATANLLRQVRQPKGLAIRMDVSSIDICDTLIPTVNLE